MSQIYPVRGGAVIEDIASNKVIGEVKRRTHVRMVSGIKGEICQLTSDASRTQC